jgi:hypothetical protein
MPSLIQIKPSRNTNVLANSLSINSGTGHLRGKVDFWAIATHYPRLSRRNLLLLRPRLD